LQQHQLPNQHQNQQMHQQPVPQSAPQSSSASSTALQQQRSPSTSDRSERVVLQHQTHVQRQPVQPTSFPPLPNAVHTPPQSPHLVDRVRQQQHARGST
jgi:hypothetical protein